MQKVLESLGNSDVIVSLEEADELAAASLELRTDAEIARDISHVLLGLGGAEEPDDDVEELVPPAQPAPSLKEKEELLLKIGELVAKGVLPSGPEVTSFLSQLREHVSLERLAKTRQSSLRGWLSSTPTATPSTRPISPPTPMAAPDALIDLTHMLTKRVSSPLLR